MGTPAARDGTRERISRGRLEAISDGIMAVAITLLALNIDPPERAPGESLWEAVDGQVLGEIGVFLLSFLLIARFWMVHHRVFALLPEDVGTRFVLVNFGFLATICLMPFATELYSGNADDITALAAYAGAMALASVLISVLFALAGRVSSTRVLLVPLIFLAAIPIGLVIGPQYAPFAWLALSFVPDGSRGARSAR